VRVPSEDYLDEDDDDDPQFDIVNEEDQASDEERSRRTGSPYLAALHRIRPLQDDRHLESLERRVEEECELERLTSSSEDEKRVGRVSQAY
jgi:hypothetical protein